MRIKSFLRSKEFWNLVDESISTLIIGSGPSGGIDKSVIKVTFYAGYTIREWVLLIEVVLY